MDEARKGELAGASESIEPDVGKGIPLSKKSERDEKAGAGIEPANSGFADRSLTTWLPRRCSGSGGYRVTQLCQRWCRNQLPWRVVARAPETGAHIPADTSRVTWEISRSALSRRRRSR
jgi:hypothetical protein